MPNLCLVFKMAGSVSRECFSGCLLDGFGWHFSARLSRFSLLCVSPANKTTTRWHYPNRCPSELSLQLFGGFACPNVSLFSFPSPPLSSSPPARPQKSVKEGILLKQTSSFQRWKRRYFKLRGRTLYYAKDCKVPECIRRPRAALMSPQAVFFFFFNHIYFHTKACFSYRPTWVVGIKDILSTFILRGYVSRRADVFLSFHFISLLFLMKWTYQMQAWLRPAPRTSTTALRWATTLTNASG